eukprot:TRINITY_DN357_c1_g1_i4.p1 TRINITY_DN357_c1_g1~~TRINITY_DN357_c1_g1_i4.p1  ORF type:complete len:306 (+),score=19.34 TRINITY_DN357_c1_g1_i4:38-955(+)
MPPRHSRIWTLWRRFRWRYLCFFFVLYYFFSLFFFSDVEPAGPSILWEDSLVVVVSATSENHFDPQENLMRSARRANVPYVFYDLGLPNYALKRIDRLSWENFKYRKFPFEDYPPHFNMEVMAGQWAWKPVIIEQVFREMKGKNKYLIWLDSGCYITSLSRTIERLESMNDAIYISNSSGTLARWTHPKMWEYFSIDPNKDDFGKATPIEAGCAVYFKESDVYQKLIVPWRDCALESECIGPKGSNKKNHRQDQAALGILMKANGYPIQTERLPGVSCKCDRWFYDYIGNRLSLSWYEYFCSYRN